MISTAGALSVFIKPISFGIRHKKKRRNNGVFQMDLAGVEPASESPSIEASPITVIILTFPLPAA